MRIEDKKQRSTHFVSREEIEFLTQPIPSKGKALFKQLILSAIIFAVIISMIILY